MLIQDDFVGPKMNVDRHLQRSSWKAEAIRRGELKISGPIPITEETPLNEEEERQYAEKGHLDLHTSAQSVDSDILGIQQAHTPSVQPVVTENVSPNGTGDEGIAAEEQEPVHVLRHKVSRDSLRGTGELQARSSTQPLSYAASSPYAPLPRSSTTAAAKKKRGGSIRNVFRKMFGRRGREEQHEPSEPVIRHSHHRSEPITIHESPKMTRENVSGTTRISDLPVPELEPINPLGQHLPFPMNVNAPQQASPPHNYISFDRPSLETMGRRATLPNILHHHTVAGQDDAADPEPPQHDGRQIGIALSSPPQTSHSIQSKRRSRSAGALRDLARNRPSVERRRSDEIRYWRASNQSGSVYSTVSPRPQTARTVDTVRTVEGLGATVVHEYRVHEVEAPERAESRTAQVEEIPQAELEQESQVPLPLPVGAFNFGNLQSSFLDVEGPEDEDEEVQAEAEAGSPHPTPHPHNRLSIEDRVSHLESHLLSLETKVRQISTCNNRHTIILENAPSGPQYRNRTSSPSQPQTHSSTPERTTPPSPPHPHPPSPTLQSLSFSSPSPPPNAHVAVASSTESLTTHLTHLTQALHSERLARKALQHDVSVLRNEIASLHALVHRLLSRSQLGSPSYPTPSPDAIVASSEEQRGATPRAPGLGVEGGKEQGGGSPETLRMGRVRDTVVSRFSGSESERDGDGEGEGESVLSGREELASLEAWATPREEVVKEF
ncbi:uncharacterized protein EI97DRAFT_208149 [Westerdykella ornata]|uniref:Uncharacterized protein n=1 Tax=Westerdykella ornata TaxID=318751 RepID=A0A6A6J806_WESOR|nr:uncharacterized protein EI97DRAFT_208149 [Westerdykella ornata]KAF2272525.1 hypothetical protein EI97DRAFT_208149 [Westerdykella ornata]